MSEQLRVERSGRKVTVTGTDCIQEAATAAGFSPVTHNWDESRVWRVRARYGWRTAVTFINVREKASA